MASLPRMTLGLSDSSSSAAAAGAGGGGTSRCRQGGRDLTASTGSTWSTRSTWSIESSGWGSSKAASASGGEFSGTERRLPGRGRITSVFLGAGARSPADAPPASGATPSSDSASAAAVRWTGRSGQQPGPDVDDALAGPALLYFGLHWQILRWVARGLHDDRRLLLLLAECLLQARAQIRSGRRRWRCADARPRLWEARPCADRSRPLRRVRSGPRRRSAAGSLAGRVICLGKNCRRPQARGRVGLLTAVVGHASTVAPDPARSLARGLARACPHPGCCLAVGPTALQSIGRAFTGLMLV